MDKQTAGKAGSKVHDRSRGNDSLAGGRWLRLTAIFRRSTPERLEGARRAATLNRLIGEGVTEATANAWIAAWQAEAAQRSQKRGSAYWDAAWAWIAEQRRTRLRSLP